MLVNTLMKGGKHNSSFYKQKEYKKIILLQLRASIGVDYEHDRVEIHFYCPRTGGSYNYKIFTS